MENTSMSLDFTQVKVEEQKENQFPTVKRLKPGIHENVTVTGVNESLTPRGKKQITIDFLGEDNESIFTANSSMEGGAVPYTLSKLKQILVQAVTEEEADKITSVEQMNQAITGKKFRLKVAGEEFVNQQSTISVKPVLPLKYFVESAALPKSDSRLRFNEVKDIKKALQATDGFTGQAVTPEFIAPKAAPSDMPF